MLAQKKAVVASLPDGESKTAALDALDTQEAVLSSKRGWHDAKIGVIKAPNPHETSTPNLNPQPQPPTRLLPKGLAGPRTGTPET